MWCNGADEIMVKLSDGREIKAELKGLDDKLDVALLKISDKAPCRLQSWG
jgi:serine protease Do